MSVIPNKWTVKVKELKANKKERSKHAPILTNLNCSKTLRGIRK